MEFPRIHVFSNPQDSLQRLASSLLELFQMSSVTTGFDKKVPVLSMTFGFEPLHLLVSPGNLSFLCWKRPAVNPHPYLLTTLLTVSQPPLYPPRCLFPTLGSLYSFTQCHNKLCHHSWFLTFVVLLIDTQHWDNISTILHWKAKISLLAGSHQQSITYIRLQKLLKI